MTRVKGGTINRARHKKVLKQTEGYFGSKHRLYRTANEQLMHSLKYAYRDRRQKKRDFRKLWITRINAACRENEISYSKFINGLVKAGVTVNRKMLSEIAIDNPASFAQLVSIAKDALNGKDYKPTAVKTEKKAAKETTSVKEEKVTKETKVKEEKVAKEKTVKEEKNDYTAMTVAELRELAKTKEVSGYSTMKKAELIDALK